MQEKDIPVVSGLFKEMYREQKSQGMIFSLREEEVEAALAAQLKSRLHFLHILECDGNIHGFASSGMVKLQRKYKLGEDEFIGFIHDLYIEPAYRGKGCGEELLAALELEMKQAGIRHIELHVISGNTGGIRFWSKNGFDAMMQVMYKSIKEE